MTVIAPGSTIGILGGGQLGRMTALAARAMGYRIHVLDPDPNCSAAPVADRCVAAAFDDAESARELARHCQVVTLEIEQIATRVLEAAHSYAPVRPSPRLVEMVQDRARQKQWLSDNGFPVGRYHGVREESDIAAAVDAMGPCIVKSSRGGYDGRGQVRVSSAQESAAAWRALGGREAVAEQVLTLVAELSVLVARRPSGEMAVYPPALNHHERLALSWSVLPAPLSPEILEWAAAIARDVALKAELEGLLCVEMFLAGGELLVNELAPRPHNSYHGSERACVTGQFEQLTRAVCDLPLGDTTVLRPAAIVNLFGDLWSNGREPDLAAGMLDGAVRLHLYGKPGPRPARKMGHLSAVGDTPLEALERARHAALRVGARTDDLPEGLRRLVI